MSPAEQIEALRKMTRRGVPVWFMRCLIAVAIILLFGWFRTQHPGYLIPLIFVAVMIYSTHRVTPHIGNAAKALERAVKTKGLVLISTKHWSDSDSYHVSIRASPSHDWSFEFIPLNWRPSEGVHEATLFRLAGIEWPALVEIEHGFVYPRQTPRLVPHDAEA